MDIVLACVATFLAMAVIGLLIDVCQTRNVYRYDVLEKGQTVLCSEWDILRALRRKDNWIKFGGSGREILRVDMALVVPTSYVPVVMALIPRCQERHFPIELTTSWTDDLPSAVRRLGGLRSWFTVGKIDEGQRSLPVT